MQGFANLNYSRVIVSSRLRMMLAKAVQAAWSIGSSPSTFADSPAITSLAASSGVCLYTSRCSERISASTPISSAVGGRETALRNAKVSLASSVSPPSDKTFCAKTLAASTKVGSLGNTSACSGVFVRGRSTVQNSRLGASKIWKVG